MYGFSLPVYRAPTTAFIISIYYRNTLVSSPYTTVYTLPVSRYAGIEDRSPIVQLYIYVPTCVETFACQAATQILSLKKKLC